MRGNKGLTLVEILVVMAIAGIMIPVGMTAVSSYQKTEEYVRRPVEMGRISAALRAFLKDRLYLPNFSNQRDLADWKNYYKPPGNTDAPLPYDFTYTLVRNYVRAGLTTGSYPGRVLITGSECSRYNGDPASYCEFSVPFY